MASPEPATTSAARSSRSAASGFLRAEQLPDPLRDWRRPRPGTPRAPPASPRAARPRAPGQPFQLGFRLTALGDVHHRAHQLVDPAGRVEGGWPIASSLSFRAGKHDADPPPRSSPRALPARALRRGSSDRRDGSGSEKSRSDGGVPVGIEAVEARMLRGGVGHLPGGHVERDAAGCGRLRPSALSRPHRARARPRARRRRPRSRLRTVIAWLMRSATRRGPERPGQREPRQQRLQARQRLAGDVDVPVAAEHLGSSRRPGLVEAVPRSAAPPRDRDASRVAAERGAEPAARHERDQVSAAVATAREARGLEQADPVCFECAGPAGADGEILARSRIAAASAGKLVMSTPGRSSAGLARGGGWQTSPPPAWRQLPRCGQPGDRNAADALVAAAAGSGHLLDPEHVVQPHAGGRGARPAGESRLSGYPRCHWRARRNSSCRA